MDLFVNNKYINWHCNFPLIFCIEFTLVHWCFHTFYGFCCPHITLGDRYRENKSPALGGLWSWDPVLWGVVWSSSNPAWALMINTTFPKRRRFLYSDLLHPNLFYFYLRSLIRWGFINSGTTDIWGWIIPNCMGLSCALWNVQQYLWLLSIKCPYNTSLLQMWQSKIYPRLPCVPWGDQNTTRLDPLPYFCFRVVESSWRKCHKPTMLLVGDTNIGGIPCTARPKIMMSNFVTSPVKSFCLRPKQLVWTFSSSLSFILSISSEVSAMEAEIKEMEPVQEQRRGSPSNPVIRKGFQIEAERIRV